ncbi:MAG: MoxR family ATPase [Planctomycetes bacterium]|nr:MoxR family ATPase [Planctomycetota bacterium]
MPAKLVLEDILVGATMEATFWPNSVKESGFRYRATHLDGRKAPKIVLCDDPRIHAGLPCLVRIQTIRKPDREDRGAIEVEFISIQQFRIEGVYLDPIVAKKLQVLLESGLNILLDGPQGCGKTVLAKSIAESLGLEFVFFNCGAVVEATDFLATIQVRASSSGAPVTEFVKTEVLIKLEEAIENSGRRYLIFLDEFNRCQESARNALMPALDSTRRLFHPIENRFLSVPDNVQFIAAVNRGGEFTGTFGIDAAQLDRFAPLQVDYMPPEEEVKLLRNRHPDLGEKIVSIIVEIAAELRKTAELGSGLSVRATDEACIYLKHPLMAPECMKMLPEVLKSSFCGRYNGRWSDVSSDAGAAWSVIERVLRAHDQSTNDD